MIEASLDPQPNPDRELAQRLAPHESYGAAARVNWPALGPVTLVSMHASPQPVPTEVIEAYPHPLRPARHGGAGVAHSGRYYYSDLYLDALAYAAAQGPVLAAGDLNEARRWDDLNPGHTWGREFFGHLPDLGLRDVTFARWGEERRTRFHPTDPDYQLDVVLASPDLAAAVSDAAVDTEWTTPDQVAAAGLSDHAPVWVTITAP